MDDRRKVRRWKSNQWKDDARDSVEEAAAEWIEKSEAGLAHARDLVRAGAPVEDTFKGLLLMRKLIVTVLRSLPPRTGRGGLSKAAKICGRFLKETALPRSRGRPTGTTEVRAEQLDNYEREICRRIEDAARRGERLTRTDAVVQIEVEYQPGVSRTRLKQEAPIILRRLQPSRRRKAE